MISCLGRLTECNNHVKMKNTNSITTLTTKSKIIIFTYVALKVYVNDSLKWHIVSYDNINSVLKIRPPHLLPMNNWNHIFRYHLSKPQNYNLRNMLVHTNNVHVEQVNNYDGIKIVCNVILPSEMKKEWCVIVIVYCLFI